MLVGWRINLHVVTRFDPCSYKLEVYDDSVVSVY